MGDTNYQDEALFCKCLLFTRGCFCTSFVCWHLVHDIFYRGSLHFRQCGFDLLITDLFIWLKRKCATSVFVTLIFDTLLKRDFSRFTAILVPFDSRKFAWLQKVIIIIRVNKSTGSQVNSHFGDLKYLVIQQSVYYGVCNCYSHPLSRATLA